MPQPWFTLCCHGDTVTSPVNHRGARVPDSSRTLPTQPSHPHWNPLWRSHKGQRSEGFSSWPQRILMVPSSDELFDIPVSSTHHGMSANPLGLLPLAFKLASSANSRLPVDVRGNVGFQITHVSVHRSIEANFFNSCHCVTPAVSSCCSFVVFHSCSVFPLLGRLDSWRKLIRCSRLWKFDGRTNVRGKGVYWINVWFNLSYLTSRLHRPSPWLLIFESSAGLGHSWWAQNKEKKNKKPLWESINPPQCIKRCINWLWMWPLPSVLVFWSRGCDSWLVEKDAGMSLILILLLLFHTFIGVSEWVRERERERDWLTV